VGRFKPAPTQPQPSFDTQVQAFISGSPSSFPTPIAIKGPPWVGHNPKAIARKGINLRLNDWELAVLRHASESKACSMQQILKEILTPALRAYVARQERSSTSTDA